MTDIQLLKAVSVVVSTNEEFREMWAKENLKNNLIAHGRYLAIGEREIEYIVVGLYGRLLCGDHGGIAGMTKLGLSSRCVHTIYPCATKLDALDCLCRKLCSFPLDYYILLRKDKFGVFVPSFYECGELVKGDYVKFINNCTIFPLKGEGWLWVEMAGNRVLHRVNSGFLKMFNPPQKYVEEDEEMAESAGKIIQRYSER